MQMRYPNEELALLIEAAIKAEPGIWTARLCRLLNEIPETEPGVIYCGRCEQYANPRKRARAKRHDAPTLPGMDAPYQMHPPCLLMPLRKLQYLLSVLWDRWDLVYGVPGSRIPDLRQGRQWDYATRYYPND